MLPKLIQEHIKLNSYSVMRVNLAAQVLSATVSAGLKKFGSPESSGTAKLCAIVESSFDCLNVRSTTEHQRKIKPFLAPYTAVDDERFLWMETTFLGYLNEWKESTQNRPGEFTENARSKMFLS